MGKENKKETERLEKALQEQKEAGLLRDFAKRHTEDSFKLENRWVTKDSGKRESYESGMVRDTQEGKPRFDLVLPLDVPFQDQMLTRFAQLMTRGIAKYGDRNWEQARSEEELNRFKSSAIRHCIQWITGEIDEDHAAAVMFNILAAETLKYKRKELDGCTNDCGKKGCTCEEGRDAREESCTGSEEDARRKECGSYTCIICAKYQKQG